MFGHSTDGGMTAGDRIRFGQIQTRTGLVPMLCIALVMHACSATPIQSPTSVPKPVSAPRQPNAAIVPPMPRDVALVAAQYEIEPEIPALSAYTSHTLRKAGQGFLGGTAKGAFLGCIGGLRFEIAVIIVCPVVTLAGALTGTGL